MAKDGKSPGNKRPIIIKREEVVEGGHHGGAWKVAYADFVTAMMAFFLLMWLLNATTSEQRRGLADYFSPTNLMSRTTSGFGAPFGGHTVNDDGGLASDRGAVQVMNASARPVFDADDDDGDTPAQAATTGDGKGAATTRLHQGDNGAAETQGEQNPGAKPDAQDPAKTERQAFEAAAAQIRNAVAKDPALADLARQLAVDIAPDGLRVQILDGDKQPMFPTGSADLTTRAKDLLQKIVPILATLPEPVSITGHTDAAPFRGGDRTNWELSSERANATRRYLAEAGIPESRMQAVAGRADRDPLLPADPLAAQNRRIAVTVLRTVPKP